MKELAAVKSGHVNNLKVELIIEGQDYGIILWDSNFLFKCPSMMWFMTAHGYLWLWILYSFFATPPPCVLTLSLFNVKELKGELEKDRFQWSFIQFVLPRSFLISQTTLYSTFNRNQSINGERFNSPPDALTFLSNFKTCLLNYHQLEGILPDPCSGLFCW